MTPSTFASILEDRVKQIEEAVALIERGDGRTPELASLRADLIDMLEHIERDPGIEAAADALYNAAARTVVETSERERIARDRRILREAALRLRERLNTAQPKPK